MLGICAGATGSKITGGEICRAYVSGIRGTVGISSWRCAAGVDTLCKFGIEALCSRPRMFVIERLRLSLPWCRDDSALSGMDSYSSAKFDMTDVITVYRVALPENDSGS